MLEEEVSCNSHAGKYPRERVSDAYADRRARGLVVSGQGAKGGRGNEVKWGGKWLGKWLVSGPKGRGFILRRCGSSNG